ncbi:methyltransferase domain-containing protein, partial [Acidobacteriota bacterium]
MDSYARKLIDTFPMRKPVLQHAIKALRLPAGSLGLDAGCGVGLQTLMLSEAVQPDGHVTGLDISTGLLDHARKFAKESGLGEYLSFQEGNINQLPFDNNSFNWLWSSDCAGYSLQQDPVGMLK